MQSEFALAQLRARVLSQLPDGCGVILIAAPGKQADASVVAVRLANAIADSGRPALLVEAASIPTGLDDSAGVGIESLAHALQSNAPAPAPGELAIYGGPLDSGQIAGPTLQSFLRAAAGAAAVVLLTSQMAGSADALALAPCADLTLLAVCDGQSRRRQYSEAVNTLTAAGLAPLGMVAAPATQ